MECLATRGVCGILSVADSATRIELSAHDLITHRKSIVGVLGGNGIPKLMIPLLVDLHREGRLPLEKLVRFYPLARIEDAFADAASGEVIKPVVLMKDEGKDALTTHG